MSGTGGTGRTGGPVRRESAVGWVDARSGASGDMLLGAVHDALVALGLDPGVMSRAAAAVAPVGIEVGHEQRGGFRVARAHVTTTETDPPHRTWRDVRGLLESADLDPAVRRLAFETFERLAVAEGAVHGVGPEEIHFHEVGAHDAVGDVVGVCAGFAALGLTALHVSPIALGGGTASTSHGVIPIPGPAVLELLRGSDLVAHGGPVDEELCTPTGAALLATLGTRSGPMPPMTVSAVGLGAGSRHTGAGLGALRLVVGERADLPSGGGDVVLESNVDDLDPRLWPGVLQALLDAGASDAWLTPILMKKGRPAHTLHVLVPAGGDAREIREVVFRQTSAIGLRETAVVKIALDRSERLIQVDGQDIRVKLAMDGAGRVLNAQPEFADIAAAAQALGRPAKTVLTAAVAAAFAQLDLDRPAADS